MICEFVSKYDLPHLTSSNFLLYPTQRVAEGIMSLTRPSVSPSVLFFLLAELL